jgi:NAD(P)-dependent dehydrogenase (short-subunit alcohol dehydrogenase family)
MQEKPVALVTGANKGIGLQIAKDLAARGFLVLVGSRDIKKGEVASTSIGADARAIQLDVTDAASIASAAERIRKEFGRLDVLVNNAGIAHAGKPGKPLAELVKAGRPSVASLAEVRAVFETNVFGVVAVTQAMLPLLREAPAARIVNVSSGTGSLARNSDPANPPASRLTPHARASPPRTSTTSRARAPSSRAPANPSASPCSMRAAPRARTRMTTARCRGDGREKGNSNESRARYRRLDALRRPDV